MAKLFLTLMALSVMSMAQVKAKEYAFTESYKVSSPLNLKINMNDSDISIKSSEGNTLEIQYYVWKNNKALEMTKDKLLSYYDISIVEGKGTFEITSKSKLNNNSKNWREYIYLSLEVFVPTNTLASIESIDGDIALSGLEGKQYAKTHDGDIVAVGIKGAIELLTGDGDIVVKSCIGNARLKTGDGDIAISQLKGRVEAISGDGDVAVSKLVGNISVKTTDGDISLATIKGGVKAHTGDGDISGTIVEFNEELSFISGDGDISVNLPVEVGFNLEIIGEDLQANFKDFNGDVSESYIKGKVRGGGVPVSIRTGDGTVRLNY